MLMRKDSCSGSLQNNGMHYNEDQARNSFSENPSSSGRQHHPLNNDDNRFAKIQNNEEGSKGVNTGKRRQRSRTSSSISSTPNSSQSPPFLNQTEYSVHHHNHHQQQNEDIMSERRRSSTITTRAAGSTSTSQSLPPSESLQSSSPSSTSNVNNTNDTMSRSSRVPTSSSSAIFSSSTSSILSNPSISHSSERTSSSRQQLTSGPEQQLTGSDVRRAVNGVWSSSAVSFFACFLCCFNFYSLSRFAILAYFFKGSFMLQFLLLSLGFGLPLLLFFCSLGQYLGSGFCDLWYISPAFTGIGYAFLLTYSVISIYWSLPIAWFFVFFRDSFLSSRETPFRWAYCSLVFNTDNCIHALNASSYEYIGWSVSSYFHGKTLDRRSDQASKTVESGIKPDLILNLGIVWCLVFLCLYQGLHRAGKVIVLSASLPLLLFTVTSFRFIEAYGDALDRLFTFNDKPFFLDSSTWLLAARETFMVWTVFGASSLSVCSHNKSSHRISYQLIVMFLLVITMLFMSACFFTSCMDSNAKKGVLFTPSSFERENDTGFLRDPKLLPSGIKIQDLEVVSASNLLLGESLMTGKLSDRESRYAIARFATEVFPAMLAAEGPSKISSFWPMVFYFSVIVMNLGSLIVLFGTVVDAVMTMNSRCMNGWRPSIAFSMCALAFVFSLPLATRFGLHVMYFIDFCFGSLWWMSLLYLLFIISILVVRGRPVGTENLVNMLVITKSRRLWVLPLLTFHWNLMIPVAIMILSVSFTRSHSINGLTWTQVVSLYTHWPPWAQWLSVCVQVFPLLIVFIYGLFKATFILTTSPKPLHERLQELFCPILTTIEMRRRGTFVQGMDPDTGVVNEGFREDPPPKYTPPPSYSAATSRNARRQLRLGSNITIDIPNLANIMTTPPTDQSQEDTQRKQSVVSTSSQLASSSTSQVKASHSMTNK